MKICLYDSRAAVEGLYPFTLSRPVADLRNGMFTIAARWQWRLGQQVFCLSQHAAAPAPAEGPWLMIDASIFPENPALFQDLFELQLGEALIDDQGLLAYLSPSLPELYQLPVWPGKQKMVDRVYRLSWSAQLVQDNMRWMEYDAAAFAGLPTTAASGAQIFGDQMVYIHPGAIVQGTIINASEGPVVVDEGALVMEGSCLRGPVYIGKHAVVKMGAHLYAGTNIGERCTAGGEIKNAVLMAFSNKAHDGYLGDSVLGHWCNLGAGTCVSNVKNTASAVKVWHEHLQTSLPAGNKFGCLIGDYTRTGILTAISTGTTIGACCSLHHGMPPMKQIPSFWWGGGEVYALPNAAADIAKWMAMKGQTPPDDLMQRLTHIFEADHPVFSN